MEGKQDARRSFGLLLLWGWISYVLHMFNVLQALPRLLPRLLPGPQTVTINGRKFNLLRQLGEGGYAVVHLAQEVATPERPLVEDQEYAVKKVHLWSSAAYVWYTFSTKLHTRVLLGALEGAVNSMWLVP